MPGHAEKGLAFVDTNVFVYAYDRQADERQLAARMLIQRLVDEASPRPGRHGGLPLRWFDQSNRFR